jgi:hypothetical protein
MTSQKTEQPQGSGHLRASFRADPFVEARFDSNSEQWSFSFFPVENLTLARLSNLHQPVMYWAPRRCEVERIVQLACALHGDAPGNPTILEVGAGSGLLSYLLAETKKVDVIALEPNSTLVERTPYRSPNLTYVTADAADAVALYRESKITVVINSHMPPNVNLTPAIRSIGASAIVYALLRYGGTGVPENEAKFLQLRYPTGVDDHVSYRPGVNYRRICEWFGPAHCDIVEWLTWSHRGYQRSSHMDFNKIDVQINASVPEAALETIRSYIDGIDASSLLTYPWEDELTRFRGPKAGDVTWLAGS